MSSNCPCCLRSTRELGKSFPIRAGLGEEKKVGERETEGEQERKSISRTLHKPFTNSKNGTSRGQLCCSSRSRLHLTFGILDFETLVIVMAMQLGAIWTDGHTMMLRDVRMHCNMVEWHCEFEWMETDGIGINRWNPSTTLEPRNNAGPRPRARQLQQVRLAEQAPGVEAGASPAPCAEDHRWKHCPSHQDVRSTAASTRRQYSRLRQYHVHYSAAVRRGIARVLTVTNSKQRQNLREFYKKKQYLPLDLRTKKTRAIRRKLTKVGLAAARCRSSGRQECDAKAAMFGASSRSGRDASHTAIWHPAVLRATSRRDRNRILTQVASCSTRLPVLPRSKRSARRTSPSVLTPSVRSASHD